MKTTLSLTSEVICTRQPYFQTLFVSRFFAFSKARSEWPSGQLFPHAQLSLVRAGLKSGPMGRDVCLGGLHGLQYRVVDGTWSKYEFQRELEDAWIAGR